MPLSGPERASKHSAARMDNPSLLDILQLEQIEQDIYRARLVLAEQYSLYGGQVAAQALLAAGLTVDAGQLCQTMSSALIDWPSGRSDFATRTSTVST